MQFKVSSILLVGVLLSSGALAQVPDGDCVVLSGTFPEHCDQDRIRSDRGTHMPFAPRLSVFRTHTDTNFVPVFIARNDSCVVEEGVSYNTFESVSFTESWHVTQTVTVEVSQEVRASVSVRSVGEAETGIKSTVSHALEMGFERSATVNNGQSLSIEPRILPKHEYSVTPFVRYQDIRVSQRVFNRIETWRIDCTDNQGHVFESTKACGIQDFAATATIAVTRAAFTSTQEQFGECPGGGSTDTDGDGIPDVDDPDIDGDGWANEHDTDTDGDGIPNDVDTDDDGDGIPDSDDPNSPTGPNQTDDIDGDGIPNDQDDDIDGDGLDNDEDTDDDGDGVDDEDDPDADGDGVPDSNPWINIFEIIRNIIREILDLLR